jgi:hypothetical protein
MKPFAKIINEELVIGVESKTTNYTVKIIKKGECVNELELTKEFKELIQISKIR